MSITDSTRDRIIAAAQAEFAQYGIAGARVDRIAQAARTSKERVYAYFRGKEELYRLVAAQVLAELGDAVPLDPADLPGYAAGLFDYFTGHPDRFRFVSWGHLELASGGPGPGASDPYGQATAAKIEKIRGAQEAGKLDPSWDPADICVLVSQIATAWIGLPTVASLGRPGASERAVSARRATVVRSVQALFPAAGAGLPADPVEAGQLLGS
jgi:AcrR family transcriptional regulator